MMDILLNSYLALNFGVDHFEVAQTHRQLLTLLANGQRKQFIKAIEARVSAAAGNLLKIAERSPLFSDSAELAENPLPDAD